MFHNILNNEGKNLAHEISQFLRIEWAYYSSFLGFRAQATRVSYKPVSYIKKTCKVILLTLNLWLPICSNINYICSTKNIYVQRKIYVFNEKNIYIQRKNICIQPKIYICNEKYLYSTKNICIQPKIYMFKQKYGQPNEKYMVNQITFRMTHIWSVICSAHIYFEELIRQWAVITSVLF